MWDDVIIGNGDSMHSAVKSFDGDHGISENSNCYWISRCIMNTKCTIFKDTNQGKNLTKMIKNKESLEKIQGYIDSVIIENIAISKFKKKLKEFGDMMYNNGKRDKIEEFKKVLDID